MGTPDLRAVPCRILEDGTRCGLYTQRISCGRHAVLTRPRSRCWRSSTTAVHQPPSCGRHGGSRAARAAIRLPWWWLMGASCSRASRCAAVRLHQFSTVPAAEIPGAAPIQWSVIRGEAVTGVTSMFMDAGMDTGDLIDTTKRPSGKRERRGAFPALSPLAPSAFAHPLAIAEGTVGRTRGSMTGHHGPMLEKAMGALDFTKPAALRTIRCGHESLARAASALPGKREDTRAAVPKAGQPAKSFGGALLIPCAREPCSSSRPAGGNPHGSRRLAARCSPCKGDFLA